MRGWRRDKEMVMRNSGKVFGEKAEETGRCVRGKSRRPNANHIDKTDFTLLNLQAFAHVHAFPLLRQWHGPGT